MLLKLFDQAIINGEVETEEAEILDNDFQREAHW